MPIWPGWGNTRVMTIWCVCGDCASATLSADQFHEILRLLSESSITYINNGEAADARDLYDAVLEFGEDGAWTWTAKQAGPMIDAGSHVSKSG